jgi:hypothetical protein
VASVDIEVVPDAKLGKIRVGSATVDRRYTDYHIKSECIPYVNNNGDSWSRKVLLASYPTFIGAHNFQEHVQQEEKSKGRIIDAVARDIGHSVYVDILVATNRKHANLVRKIEANEMGTLSMGCTTDFTICTKCGHYAVDETDLCKHVAHEKLNTFIDDQGVKRVIAELCGHINYTDNEEAPGGVRFIEASWVGVPAFPGAVMHQIINAGESGLPESEIRRMLAKPAQFWSDTAIAKAASLSTMPGAEGTPRVSFEFGQEDEAEGEGEGEAPADPFQGLEDEVFRMMTERVHNRFKKQMRKKEVEIVTSEPSSDAPNDTIIKEGFNTPARTSVRVAGDVPAAPSAAFLKRHKAAAMARYKVAVDALTRSASSDAALVDGLSAINASYGWHMGRDVYRSALRVGAISKFPSIPAYRRALRKVSGRDFSSAELRVVVRVGTLLSHWESTNNPIHSPNRSSQ